VTSGAHTPVQDRHAFRPDLHEAELEDRILLAIGPPSAYLMAVNTSGFSNYFNVPGFSYYFGNGQIVGGNRSSGPIGAMSGLASQLGPGLTMGGSATQATGGPSSGSLRSFGSLLGLSAAYGGGGDASSIHNNGPTGTSSPGNTVGGYGSTFSTGGNFAASYSGTYNGFNSGFEFSASSANARAAASATGADGPTLDQVLESAIESEGNTSSQHSVGQSMTTTTSHKADNLPHPADPFSFFRRSPSWSRQAPSGSR
jgi:hypothetical protein